MEICNAVQSKSLTSRRWGGKLLVALCALTGAAPGGPLQARADGDPYANDVTMSLKESVTRSWNSGGYWSDGQAPDPSKTYSVTPGGILFVSTKTSQAGDNPAWGGGRLAISGILRVEVFGANGKAIYVPDLVLREGGEVQSRYFGPFWSNLTENVATSVRVEGTSGKPARITNHYDESYTSSGSVRQNVLTADFTGTSESVLEYERPAVNYEGRASDRGLICRIDPLAFANYPGTFRLTGACTIASPDNTGPSSFAWPQTAFRVEDGALCKFNRLDFASDFVADASLRSLAVEDAEIAFGYNTARNAAWPLVTVTEGFSVDAHSTVTLMAATIDKVLAGVSPDNPNGSTALKLVHLAGDAAEGAPAGGLYPAASITLGNMSGDVQELPDSAFRLMAVDSASGGKDVILAAPSLVTMTNAAQHGSFEAGHAGDWSNGETPAAGSDRHYWNTMGLSIFKSVELPSATLTLGNSLSWKGGPSVAFREVNIFEGGVVGAWAGEDGRVLAADRLNVLSKMGTDSPATIWAGVSKIVTIDAELQSTGAGLTLRSENVPDGYFAQIDLNRASTNFHGRLTFTAANSGGAAYRYATRTRLGDARSWGGAYTASADGYDAITLAKHVHVSVTNDVTFSEPTRGLLVSGGARFDVPGGRTLRFENQVTWAGELVKTGAGVLDLAGTARFVDGAAGTAPLAATNVLTVAEGALRVSSAAAADGLAVSFAEGTRLVVPSDGEKGYCNLKWDVPLAIGAASGVLPVEIAVAKSHEAAETLETPVATFGAAAAASIPASAFRVLKTAAGHRCRAVAKRENADGSVTYVAQMFRRLGLVFVIR